MAMDYLAELEKAAKRLNKATAQVSANDLMNAGVSAGDAMRAVSWASDNMPKLTTAQPTAAQQLASATSKPPEVTTTFTKPMAQAPTVAPVEKTPLMSVEPKAAPVAPAQAPATAPAQPITIQPRPISPEVQNFLNQLQAKINAAPVTADQIMQSQEYQNQSKAIDDMAKLNIGNTTASIRRQLASRNMIRSTPAVQALTSAEGDISLKANADKAALIPSMLTAAYNRQQTELKNLGDLINTMSGLEETAFNQGYTEFTATAPYNMLTKAQEQTQKNWETEYNDAKTAAEAKTKADADKALYDNQWKVAEQTGLYYDPAQLQLANATVTKKEEYEAGKAQGKTDTELAGLSAEAQKARDQLKAMGIDADAIFGANVTATEARKNIGMLGQWTLEGRKKEWELTGVDPVTGATNPEFMLKDMQAAKWAADAALSNIEAQIAADPVYGASAKAKADLAKAQKESAKVDAEIAATWALANERNQSKTTETATDKAAREAQEKTYSTNVEGNMKTYYVGRPAAELWEDFQMLKGEAGSTQAQEAILAQMIKAVPVSARDLQWLTNIWNASQGNALYRGALDEMRTNPKP